MVERLRESRAPAWPPLARQSCILSTGVVGLMLLYVEDWDLGSTIVFEECSENQSYG